MKQKSVRKKTETEQIVPEKCPVKKVQWELFFEKEKVWKITFFALAAVILALMMMIAPQMGDADDGIDGINGEYALKYYTEGDTTFAHYDVIPVKVTSNSDMNMIPFLKYYGVGFEILPAVAIKYFHFPANYEMELRHILCALFGFIVFLFCGFIAKELKNWKLAFLSFLLIAATPVIFGGAFVNYKDAPLGAGFAISIFAFIRIYNNLPKFRIIDIVIAVVGIALAISIRIGGAMIPFYFAVGAVLLLIFNKELRKTLFAKKLLFLKVVAVCVGFCTLGIISGLCLYPNFFYEGAIEHVKNAMTIVSKFPQVIPILWEGKYYNSVNLPEHYLLKSYLYTIPLFIFSGAALFILNIRKISKQYSVFRLVFLLFTVIFPVLYILYGKSPIYNGWRHTQFVYSSFVPFVAIGFYETFQWLKNNKILKIIAAALFVLCISPTIIWACNNYKHCFAYYNVLVDKPYGRYDQDCADISEVVLFERLAKELVKDTAKHYTVYAKNLNVMMRQDRKKYPNITVYQGSARGFALTDCDYFILGLQFMPPNVIKSFFPPKEVVYAEYIDGKPIGAVVKKSPLDVQGIKLLQQNRFQEALDTLEKAYAFNPRNFGLWYYMAICYFYTGQYQKSIDFFTKNDSCWATEEQRKTSAQYRQAAFAELQKQKNEKK